MSELLERLAKSEEDAASGRVAPVEETFSELKSILMEKIEKIVD